MDRKTAAFMANARRSASLGVLHSYKFISVRDGQSILSAGSRHVNYDLDWRRRGNEGRLAQGCVFHSLWQRHGHIRP